MTLRKLLLYILLFTSILAAQNSFSGCAGSKNNADKATIKKWKKKAKDYVKNPLSLKAKEEACEKKIDELEKRVRELMKENADMRAELDNCAEKCQRELRALRNKIDSLQNEYSRIQKAYETVKTATQSPVELTPGLFYRVQVGAYQKFNMNRYLEHTGDNFTGESVDNLNKYLMGKFKNYELAKAFRDDIIKLGIKDAFIVAFNDGKRITTEEAQRLQREGRAR
jgi:prefoldin subunit 5